MSMLMCPCGTYIDSDYDVECFMVDDEVACESCRCQDCGERKAEPGIEQCMYCAVEEYENDPAVLDTYHEPFRAQVIAWAGRVDRERTAKLQEACGVRLMVKQAGGV